MSVLDLNAQVPPAEAFAQSWVAAWNARDLAQILAHYREDFEICTPMIARVQGGNRPCLQGKAAIAAYWAAGLQKFPDLHFELQSVLRGVGSLAIHYLGVQGQPVTEVMWFDAAGVVYRAAVFYPEVSAERSS